MISNYKILGMSINKISRMFLVFLILLMIIRVLWANIFLTLIGTTLVAIYALIPGLAIWMSPNISLAWLNGLNPWIFPDVSWEKLGSGRRIILYIDSIGFFVIGIIAVISLLQTKFP